MMYYAVADVPNSGKTEKTDDYPKGYPVKIISGERLKFNKFFQTLIKELEEKKPVIITGDLNVAHHEIGEKSTLCLRLIIVYHKIRLIINFTNLAIWFRFGQPKNQRAKCWIHKRGTRGSDPTDAGKQPY
jgi:hypothetical protein